MISKPEFIDRLRQLPDRIYSKTKSASYTNFIFKGNTLQFKRVNTEQIWDLDIDILYDIYRNNPFINTTTIKNITGKRVNSPSIAVLMAIGCIDGNGNRL
jgi:hypothetical protein